MSPEFRAGERDVTVRCECTECGKPAEGNASWTDGSGEICDACVAADSKPRPSGGQVTEPERPPPGAKCKACKLAPSHAGLLPRPEHVDALTAREQPAPGHVLV